LKAECCGGEPGVLVHAPGGGIDRHDGHGLGRRRGELLLTAVHLALSLPPEVAIGTGLVTEVFGFDSGLYAYATKRLMDYRLGAALLIVTIPMALVGPWVAGVVAQDSLEDVLGVGLVAVTASFLQATNHENVELIDSDIRREEAIPGSVSSTATSCSSVAASQARPHRESLLFHGARGDRRRPDGSAVARYIP
jgi:uncharacterized membrane protein YfcA